VKNKIFSGVIAVDPTWSACLKVSVFQRAMLYFYLSLQLPDLPSRMLDLVTGFAKNNPIRPVFWSPGDIHASLSCKTLTAFPSIYFLESIQKQIHFCELTGLFQETYNRGVFPCFLVRELTIF
jgi:hypothetical protein